MLGRSLCVPQPNDPHYKTRGLSSDHNFSAWRKSFLRRKSQNIFVIVYVYRGDHATESYHRCASRDQITWPTTTSTANQRRRSLSGFAELYVTSLLCINLFYPLFLARFANLPTGLYILLALISSFFYLRQIISGSTGPIFTIFSPNERYLREFSRSGPLCLLYVM